MLGLLAAPAASAQQKAVPAKPANPPTTAAPRPERESEAAPLPAKKLEEALQLLLKATAKDSATQNSRQRPFRPTEIEGLVVDQTITKVGHDFYDAFFTLWEAPANAGDYTIIIREKPARGINILISVEVNENELLELPLQPKLEVIEETATYAVGVAADYVINSRNVSQQLETGDQAGSGIF
ncbi:CsgE family curli-type amyloid fiber assembly protein [Hymenobacter algoricola]|uniref:Curli production assembly/transport component CsgE n=1 Tax=Hymenobacter algoricola TaxID=486267 RepID=A0ABP7MNF5_9BACT